MECFTCIGLRSAKIIIIQTSIIKCDCPLQYRVAYKELQAENEKLKKDLKQLRGH